MWSEKVEQAVRQCRQDESVSEDDLHQMAEPLEQYLRRQIRNLTLRKLAKLIVLIAAAVAALLYTPLYLHLRAFGRIGLVKLTPYWDWMDYYYDDCLIRNWNNRLEPADLNTCNVCEDVGRIDAVANVSFRWIQDRYVSQDIPVVVADGAADWPLVNSRDIQLADLAEAYHKDDTGTNICHLSTNLRLRSSRLMDLFRLTDQQRDRPWFAHWENCGKRNAKTGRRFYQRPYFVSPAADLSFSNWVLVSSQYTATQFKAVALRYGLGLVAQIHGFNTWKLVAKEPCPHICPPIHLTLNAGEILVMSPRRWQLHYQPGEGSNNMAVIIQGEID